MHLRGIARLVAALMMAVGPARFAGGEEGRREQSQHAGATARSSDNSPQDAWSDPHNPIAILFGGERLDLWSLKPVRAVEPPSVRDAPWVQNPIDSFVLARLEAADLSPPPQADPRVLIRRVFFDLTGLPPTPQEVAHFLADERADAWERLVDGLLASPRYGEHAARMWLDVVRYSDSNGFDWDEYRPSAWRYRDYVIRSFNSDKPYDIFLVEQLAGDELVAGPPRTLAEQDMLLATGFLRIGPQDNSASLFNEQDRARAEWMFDVVETTGSGLLGLTFTCCRCHDHKHDPLSQADYYRLKAFFEPLRYAEDVPLDLADEQAAVKEHNAAVEAHIWALEEERRNVREPVRSRIEAEKIASLTDAERRLLEAPEEGLSAEQRASQTALRERVAVSDEEVTAALGEPEKQRDKALAADIEARRGEVRKHLHGLIATDAAEDPGATYILAQGDHRAAGERVQPGFPSVLEPGPAEISRGVNPKTHGRRLTLARWIASPDNRLTARVLVNRVWQMHFGRGLVETAGDFGLAGAGPTHPELLDWLASQFVRDGWSLKRLHRLIVTSATYRQAALAPRTQSHKMLLAGRAIRRLTAEQLRDALLAVSGLLTDKEGGTPVWPELPSEILQANPAFLDDNAEKTKGWYASPPDEQWARSIFLVQKRGVQVPFMETFDQPGNSVSCPRRNVSTVAPQALSLLNSRVAVAAAEALAERVRNDAGGDPAAQAASLFQRALGRHPDDVEMDRCRDFLASRTLEELCRVMLNLNEFVYLE